ncbi:GMC oxidoreductase [Phytohabitans kaempferiae]|uniref:GMC oxidoreductase n=1 Tax=Phytohabitans kaempferiae TaxID=1620943 RepID=A0ABV6M2S2_9ACTN
MKFNRLNEKGQQMSGTSTDPGRAGDSTTEGLSADYVVIGSGMGGAVTARALAERGADVLIVERGWRMPREPQNWSPTEVFLNRRYKPDETWLDHRGRSFRPGVHYVVGGNTKVYGASLPRFRESDFEAVEHHDGTSPGWPFSYRDIEPFYGAAETMFRVHGRVGEDPTEPWRSTPFPHPALEHEPYVADLAGRLREAGAHPSANAMGLDVAAGGSCLRCYTCDGFPCIVDAKSDAETCAIAPALATGNVRLATGVRVTRLVAGPKGTSIQHAEATTADGPVRITARKFILSAGAANSAALLLGSADESHPHGLANSSGQVGRNFMMHNNAHFAAVDLSRRNDVVFQKTLSVHDWYHDGGDGYPLGVMQLVGKVQGAMMKSYAWAVPTFVLDQVAARSVEWLIMAEDLPHPENRVTVAPDGRIVVSRKARGTTTHRKLMRRSRKLLRAAGYDLIATQPFDISMNAHMCGTTVAGNDPATSVLDGYCRSHDVENLWVIDAGFFPSSAAMNPALTIAAQALRVVAESELAT